MEPTPIMGVPSTMGDDFQMNIRILMERGCRIQPNTEIVTLIENGNGTHRMSYKQAQYRATRIASALSKHGIKPGDRIGTFMFNNGRQFVLTYAVPCMGCVFHGINFRLHTNELEYIIKHANDQIIFIDCELLPLFEQIPKSAFTNVKKFVICGKDEKPGNWKSNLNNTIDFESFELMGDTRFDWPNMSEQSGLGLCYTGGTTGVPKPVLYSHRSTYIHTLHLLGADSCEFSGTDCFYCGVPFFHVLSACTPFVAYTIGMKYLMHGSINDFDKVVNFVQIERCTVALGVPTIFQFFQNAISNNESKYSTLVNTFKRILIGGSQPPADLLNWYEARGIRAIQLWGMTETNPLATAGKRLMTRNDLKLNEQMLKYKKEGNLTKSNEINDILTQNIFKAGRFHAGISYKIVDCDNLEKTLNCDEKGELLVKGPTITKSYFNTNENDLIGKFTKDGYLITGDIGSMNNKEQLTIHDRSKDMIKTGGEWISSIDMENHVTGLSFVERAAVVAVKHPKWIERPIIIIQLKDKFNKENDKSQFKNQIYEKLKEKYAKFQMPDDIVFWDQIPLTGPGKMSKKECRNILKQQNYVLPQLLRQKSKL